jgi:SpoVK/Ycf46/Vps4 family AAA+-type ATPase
MLIKLNMEISPFVLLFGIISYYSFLIKDILLLFLKRYNIRKYTISYDKEVYKKLFPKLEIECSSTDTALTRGNKRIIAGWFWNKKIFGYIDTSEANYSDSLKITFLTTNDYFEYLTKNEETTFNLNERYSEISIKKTIPVFSRHGHFKSFEYIKTVIDATSLNPILGQQRIINNILEIYKKKQQCKIFIEGPPCSGKSSIGYLISKELNAGFCNTFNPSDPGDSITMTLSKCQDWLQDTDIPFVFVIDEIDIILKKIHNNEISLNNKISTTVYDKPTWSKFMDNLRFFKNLIVIFTSNSSKDKLDLLDPAYLRKGRIDLYEKLDVSVYNDEGIFIGDI